MSRDGVEIIPATAQQAAVITGHRRAMFADMGYSNQAQLDAMAKAFTPWLERKMQAAEYLAWFAVTGEQQIVAGLGLWLMDWPPHMIGAGARRGNILNVYVESAFRRQGIARRLMQVAMEWCNAGGIDHVILHASADGRRLYESLGFSPTNEMCLLPPTPPCAP